jgi:hydrogenase nickel incorporation protein HypA/HybF
MTMHEYSIVQALLERVEREAEARGASRVVRVHVRLGEYSGVEPQLLATAYDTFRERTICEGAPLVLDRVPGDDLILQRIEMEVPDV